MFFQYFRAPLDLGIELLRKHGDTLMVPGKPSLVITSSPEGLKALYAADPDTFFPLNQEMAPLIGAHSMLLLGGVEHRAARKLMMPPFHGARMRAYGQLMCQLALEHSADWQPGTRVTVQDVAARISLDVILQAVLGVTDRARMQELAGIILETVHGISPLIAAFPKLRREFFGLGPWATFQRRMRALHQAFDQCIAAARASAPRDDILSMLIHARDEQGQPMPDNEVRDHLLTLILAGHETTAISISWAFYALHRPENADALARLRREISAVPGDAEPEKIAGLTYLEAVCHETLRRYPLAPAPAPRRLLKPLEVAGFLLPEGMAVAAGIGMAHFRPETYPEPLKFLPERFLDRRYGPFEFIPYGGGARRCLGAAMASYEMKLVVFTLLRKFTLRLESLKQDPGAVRAANVGTKSGVPMVVETVAS